MAYWLMKSEPDEFSIDDLAKAPKKTTPWFGVRNYQARNFMRDRMRVGDGVLFYHSSCEVPGIAGIAKVASKAKSKREDPRWVNVDVKLVKKTRLMPLEEMRSYPQLAQMRTLRPGNRLSITPVSEAEWRFILGKLE
jgi:predicted RNA-binding protein with PUA-like domain